MRWNEVTALFGGTFDPPHLGHREAISGLFSEPGVRQVLVLPSPSPPHKPAQASAEHRLKMVELAFGNLSPEISIDSRELNRPGPSYTFDTLQDIRREIPKLAFVIGADQLGKLHQWHRFPELLGLAHWIVLERKPAGQELVKKALNELQAGGLARPDGEPSMFRLPNSMVLKIVSTPALEISSTTLREEIARSGKPGSGQLDPKVEAYLKQNRLYGTGG